jgi:hypothetical protein
LAFKLFNCLGSGATEVRCLSSPRFTTLTNPPGFVKRFWKNF